MPRKPGSDSRPAAKTRSPRRGAARAESGAEWPSIVVTRPRWDSRAAQPGGRQEQQPKELRDGYERFVRFARAMGFEHFAFVMRAQMGSTDVAQVSLTSYPKAWREEYDANDYFHDDPIAQGLVTSVAPMRWRDVSCPTPAAATVMKRAATYGLVDGVTMTLRGVLGQQAAVNFAGAAFPMPDADYERCLGAILLFLSTEFELFAAWLAGTAQGARPRRLTERQEFVLGRIADGWPMKSIATELQVEVRTIQDTMDRVRKNLGVATREQAIVKAISLGLIRPSVAPYHFQ